MKKLFVPLLALSAMAFAQSERPNLEIAARNRNDYRMQDKKTMHSKNQTAPKQCRSYVYPLTWDKGNIFIEADYIYWKPVARIPYATTMDLVTIGNGAGNSAPIPTNVTIQRVNLRAKSGFKVELGAYLPPEGWTTSGEYTYLKRSNSASADGETNNALSNTAATRDINPIWRTVSLGGASAGDGDPERFTTASANQKLSYQVFDWILQKSDYWKQKFGFTPYFGVRGAWIKNKLDVTYNGIRTANSTTISLQDVARVQSDYRAGGLRAGFKGNWMLGYGLEIFGNASMSLVYGKHFIRHRENFIRAFGDTGINNQLRGSTTSANDWKALRSAFQLVLGMDWGRNFNNDNVFFGLKLAYEANIWPEVIQLRRLLRDATPAGVPNVGNNNTNDPLQDFNRTLGLHGLTLSARIDF